MATRNTAISLDRSNVPWIDAEGSGPLGTPLIKNVVANGNGVWTDLSGWKVVYLEIIEGAGGTATLTIQGSLNGTQVYTLATAPVGGATITYTGTVAVTANQAIYYTLRDLAPLVRVNVAAVAGGASVSVNVYALP
jgi:hypothetical protein